MRQKREGRQAFAGTSGCVEVLTFVGSVAAFLLIYEFIRRRSARPAGDRPQVQWAWLAAIAACALVAVAANVLLDL